MIGMALKITGTALALTISVMSVLLNGFGSVTPKRYQGGKNAANSSVIVIPIQRTLNVFGYLEYISDKLTFA